jgi:copper chaperone CopZ
MPHALRILALVLACSFLSLGIACEPTSDPAVEPASASVVSTRVYLIGVQGMHCNGCANAIATKASRVDGVASCEVSLDEATATVVAAPAAIEQVEAAISALGYTITPATAG